MPRTISKELLEIIACPKCKQGVELSKGEDALVCRRCNLVYEIREGIPIMLVDEAVTIQEYNEKHGS